MRLWTFFSALLLLLLALWGCTAQSRVADLPALAVAPLRAQFGALLTKDEQSVAVQGGVQMAISGGSMALILPHGRTLGLCRYTTGTRFGQTVVDKMTCLPVAGLDAAAGRMLHQMGLAVYRMLPGLAPDAAPTPLDGQGWSMRWRPAGEGWSGLYEDMQENLAITIHFTEVSRP